jgi:hypothetical protein
MTRTLVLAVALSLAPLACSQGASTTPRANATEARSAARTSLRADLARHRSEQIERLAAYADARQFPHNYGRPTATHIFRDGAGRLCAVANLVHGDGRDDLVEATVRTQNDLAVADVHDGPMLEWIETSGLTQEELVRIQLPAPPLVHERPRQERFAKPPPEIARAADADEARMNARVVEHIAEVRRELAVDTDKSLDIATERLLAKRSVVATVARLARL